MRLKVRKGLGYQPVSARHTPDDEAQPIGRLQLDASFAPMRRVAYEVDAARVEQRTNLDKLILDIETNGTIDAEEAVRKAAEIINDQLSIFGDFTRRETTRARPTGRIRSAAAASDRRSGGHRAFGQPSEGREHLTDHIGDLVEKTEAEAAEDAKPGQ